ncbi:MAG: hypothetical protein JXP73_08260 [Deltaproteobacteria bacterium]|nr:hypothetical protein [Deltaproteobacteria bacterium]
MPKAKGLRFAFEPTSQQVSGDARGCGGESTSGCGYLPARLPPRWNGFFAAAGLLGLAAILRRRRQGHR